jgi:hypothetical protein
MQVLSASKQDSEGKKGKKMYEKSEMVGKKRHGKAGQVGGGVSKKVKARAS